MPARPQAPVRRGYPGALLVSALLAALTALIVVALIAWRSVHTLVDLSDRRSALHEYSNAVVAFRQVLQDFVLSHRTFAVTGDPATMQATIAAEAAAGRALDRLRRGGTAVGAPDRTAFLQQGLDTASARLLRVRRAGPEAPAVARALLRNSDGPALLRAAMATLDSSTAFAAGEQRSVNARIGDVQDNLRIWIPALAALALALGALAVLLLRAQSIARAEDLTRFRAIFDNTFQFIGLLSRDGRILEANRKSLEVAGVTEDDVIGQPFWATPWWSADPAAAARVRDAVARAAQGEFVRLPIEVRVEDDRRVTIDFSITPVRGTDGQISLLVPEGRDITDQLATKQALATAEERWDFALVGSDLGVWDWNAQTNEVFYSDRWKSILGYGPEEIGTRLDEWSSRIHPDDLDATMQALNDHLDGRTPFYAVVVRLRAKDGAYRDVLARGMVVSRDADGTPLRLVGTHQDITEQHQVEADARRLREQLTALLRHSPSMLAVLDDTGRCQQVSQSVASAIGRPTGQIVGRHIDELLPPALASAFGERLAQIRRTGRSMDSEDTVTLKGQQRWFRSVLFPMQSDRIGTFDIGAIAVDVTDARLALSRLEKALDENRVLQGLLSICAQCKRIRDTDDDKWKPVETFVQSHSAAVFSHGLCPSCADAFIRDNGLEETG